MMHVTGYGLRKPAVDRQRRQRDGMTIRQFTPEIWTFKRQRTKREVCAHMVRLVVKREWDRLVVLVTEDAPRVSHVRHCQDVVSQQADEGSAACRDTLRYNAVSSSGQPSKYTTLSHLFLHPQQIITSF